MSEQAGPDSAVTTHVLDTARGVPAAGVPVRLDQLGDGGPAEIAAAATDEGGRIRALGPARLAAGTYRLTFDTGSYLAGQRDAGPGARPAFYPEVTVTFLIDDPAAHYHVPLLLSPFGYSTYRGS